MKRNSRKVISFLLSICIVLMSSISVNAETAEFITRAGQAWPETSSSPARGLDCIASIECGHTLSSARYFDAKITFKKSPYNIVLTGKMYYMPPSPYIGDWILIEESTKEVYGSYNSAMTFNMRATILYNPVSGNLEYPLGGEWLFEASWRTRNPDQETWVYDDLNLSTAYDNIYETPLHMWNEGMEVYLN